MSPMSFFGTALKEHLDSLGKTAYRVAVDSAGIDNGLFYRVVGGKRAPSENFLKKLASVPELGVSYDVLMAWKSLDDFSPEQRLIALKHMARSPEELREALASIEHELTEEYYQVLKEFADRAKEPPSAISWFKKQVNKLPFRVEFKGTKVIITDEIQGD